MDRRRAAGLLLALAACIATATAAPTASNHTALDQYDGAPDGCYYNFQHYGEGDRIMTNEPCLNCTCHNRMLMCYLRVCPFTKPIGQDCTIEKRADQCCPIVTCPDVPVDLLTSTTTSPAEYGSTGLGKSDKYGCSINGKYLSEGSKVPPTPNKPCEHCYCIRNMTTCVMQECTLHVDGCTPIYHKDVCCPVRYSCDHPEDEMPLLDDLSTTVRPTPGFLLTTTTLSPVTQMSQDCVYDSKVFPDGALIKTEKACDHCYCMKGDIVCVVQECGTPMENEGKNCSALPPREGVCCPDTYICEGDESTTGSYETYDFTTQSIQEKLTTLAPPRRTSSEGSGYRNEPDNVPYTEMPILEPEVEGSGEEEEHIQPVIITTGSPTSEIYEDVIAITEEGHEFIPLTTIKPTEEKITDKFSEEDENLTSIGDKEKTSESQPNLPITTISYSVNDAEEVVTDKIHADELGSGELPEDISLKPHNEVSLTPGLSGANEMTTERNEQDIVTSITEREFSESPSPITTMPSAENEEINRTTEQVIVPSDTEEKSTSRLPTERDFITVSPAASIETTEFTKSSPIVEENGDKSSDTSNLITTNKSDIESDVKVTTESADQNIITSISDDFKESNLESQHYPSSTILSGKDDEFVTMEPQEHEIVTESLENIEELEHKPHITASTPMLEEIEKDTMEYTEPVRIVPSSATQKVTLQDSSTTISNDLSLEIDKEDATKVAGDEKVFEDYITSTTNIPEYSRPELTTIEPYKVPEILIATTNMEHLEPEQYTPLTTSSISIDSGRRTTQSDLGITFSKDDMEHHDMSLNKPASTSQSEEVTTEPDKGLNTIPDLTEEELPVSPEAQITTLTDEHITTESDVNTIFSPSIHSTLIPSKPSTISDISASIGEFPTSTTESDFTKDKYSPTEGPTSPEWTTLVVDVTKKEMTTLQPEQTDSMLDLQHITATSTEPKYTESIKETRPSDYGSSTTISSVSEKEKTTISTPHDIFTETTTANQDDNEIFNEPRIPGEGDCLLNGITYTNESVVPSTNKCQSGCKCISSIIKCDPIICSPPPEYMNNCETVYDTPDACCPTYICDHKIETVPPQPHSQMSGTESPVSTVHCQGDECEINEDKKHNEKPTETCKYGICTGPSDESKETSSNPPSENIPEKPKIDQNDECVDGKCTPILCTDKNDCQVSPVKPCENEKCETTSDVILPQCVDGEDCVTPSVSNKECSAGNCGVIQSEDIHPKETCNEKEGCQNIPNAPKEECNEENCRRQDSTPLGQHVSELCTEPECKLAHPEIDTSTVLDQTFEGYTEEVPVSEKTEKHETLTESYVQEQETLNTLEPQEIVTTQPGLPTDGTLTTLRDSVTLVTKSESELEVSTKSVVITEYPLPVTTEKTMKDFESKTPSSGESATEITSISSTSENDMTTDELLVKVEHPQEIITVEPSTPSKILEESSTEPTKEFTFSTQDVTEHVERVKPEDATHDVINEISTKPSSTHTLESHDITKPKVEIEHGDTTIGVVLERSTEIPTTYDGFKLPENIGYTGTTVTFVHEKSTEPSIATDDQEITEVNTEKLYQEHITKKTTIEYVTELSKTTDFIEEEFTKGISDIAETETTKIVETKDEDGVVDDTKPDFKPLDDISTETSVQPVDNSVTETPYYSSTIKIHEESSHEPPKTTSSELQVTQSINVSRETPLIITEETGTQPSKTISTEALEMTKSSSEISDYEVTTLKTLDKSVTEISFPYTQHPHELTKSPQSHEDVTDHTINDSVTVPPQVYSTESQVDTQSPEKIEDKDTSVKEVSTEPISSNGSEPIYTVDHYGTTTVEESSSKEPQIYVTEPQKLPEDTDLVDTTSKISEELGTKPPKVYSTEQQEVTIAPEKIDHPATTYETETNELSKLPEGLEQEDATSKTSTESHVTNMQDASSSPEMTTTKTITESTTAIPESQGVIEHQPGEVSESASQAVSENDVETETPKSVINDLTTENTKEGDNMASTEIKVSEITTAAKELLSSESVELTTPSQISDSKYTTEPSQTVVNDVTEPSVKEQVSTVSLPIEHEIGVTVTSVTSGSEQIYLDTSPEQKQTQKPYLETQTAESITFALEKVSQPDVQETLSTQQPEKIEKDVPKPSGVDVHVTTIIPTDDRRTTTLDLGELTTLKSIDISQSPQEVEIKTDYPDVTNTAQEEHRPETSSEEVLTGTETLATLDETKTDHPAVTEKDITKTTEFETGTSLIGSYSKTTVQEENYTDQPITYASSKPAEESDATKTYVDENVTTAEPMFHETKQPDKTDDLIQSLVTGKHEINTNPSYVDQDSQTQLPIQMSSATPGIDITQSSEQDYAKDKLPTPSSISPDTELNELDSKSVTSTEHVKLVEEEKHTESPLTQFETESELTTQNVKNLDEIATTQKPLVPEENEIVTSTISEIKLSPTSPDVKIVTEEVTSATSFTKEQESASTDKVSVVMQELSTETSYTAEVSGMKVTMTDQSAVQDLEHTEFVQKVTQVPDIHIEKQTEPSDTTTLESPDVPTDSKIPAYEPGTEENNLILSDTITEISDFSHQQPELTTLKPSVDTESSTLEPTTSSKYEYRETTTVPSKDTFKTDKIQEDSGFTTIGEYISTESTAIKESTNILTSSEISPEREPPVLEHFTTIKQHEPEVYQSTLPAIQNIIEKSTYSPILPEDDSTTPVHISLDIEHTLPTEEHSIPVVISETEQSLTPNETIVSQTESAIPASDKPLQGTTSPEEELILATSETTTAQEEEKISSLVPSTDSTTRPSQKPDAHPIKSEPEVSITTLPDDSITVFPEEPVTTASLAPTTTPPVAFITTGPETPIPAVPEVHVTPLLETSTRVPEAPIISASEAPVTTSSEFQDTISSEAPVTRDPKPPIYETPEPLATNAPEPPVATASEVPKPIPTEVQATDEAPQPDEEGSFPPSGGPSGYGQEPDYVEEDQTFGPGTCRYGGKVYVSAQQIPRDDPCDFCFCFRSDIICLQQSCPPPIHGCHEEPIQGFCCPRYECPVSMATTVNVTTTTTTTTTTLPPHFPTHSYKGSVQKRGCQIKGQIYKVGEVVRASSGPCLHCTCGGDGQMKCDPKVCTPEPMLRQMIAAAVSAKRRR